MKRSNAATESGGGEMNRVTSLALNNKNSVAASDTRSSRSVAFDPHSVGKPAASRRAQRPAHTMAGRLMAPPAV